MEKKTNPVWEHIKLILWVVLIVEVLLFVIALAVGRVSDYGFTFKVSVWIGLLVAIVFLSICLVNVLEILIVAGYRKLRKRITGGKDNGDVT